MRGTSPKALKAPTLEGLRSGFGGGLGFTDVVR